MRRRSLPCHKPLRPGIVIGIMAALWVAIRSGTNPRRLAYPCQQAALAAAFGLVAEAGSLAALALVARSIRREVRPFRLVALRDAGVDALLQLMVSRGQPFHRTAAHPEGIFGSDDIVVVKPNNQWDGRNGTNSDVLKKG